ncbi:TspO/MBR family protein [Halanaeroarchaeum sulfurireducens]|uniref:Integral membrane protein n=1 Tax=Halanaeroarchaeum sulfurireducens TaxID=1604004 RepID=A0A0F7PBY3_9EURY|nr:TspO/MBR family protein [Halanaeroarchaeum sulfurireducens]AKH98237.1 integral membrane protein [Halanaeroarchaeum sulfurireducens]ALG82631.1 integral membrane protein [Halanaeroarchaeum sulfurireducens]
MASNSRLWSLPNRRPWLSLLFAIIGTELVGASGSIFTSMGLSTWYPTLTRPAIAPPDWIFAPVWTVLFALMGVAVWLVWRKASGERAHAARLALALFAGHFVVNIAWSAVYFGLQSLRGGLVVIVVLWALIVATIGAFARVDRRAGLLLVPYLAWVSFAAYLNYAFWAVN